MASMIRLYRYADEDFYGPYTGKNDTPIEYAYHISTPYNDGRINRFPRKTEIHFFTRAQLKRVALNVACKGHDKPKSGYLWVVDIPRKAVTAWGTEQVLVDVGIEAVRPRPSWTD